MSNKILKNLSIVLTATSILSATLAAPALSLSKEEYQTKKEKELTERDKQLMLSHVKRRIAALSDLSLGKPPVKDVTTAGTEVGKSIIQGNTDVTKAEIQSKTEITNSNNATQIGNNIINRVGQLDNKAVDTAKEVGTGLGVASVVNNAVNKTADTAVSILGPSSWFKAIFKK